MRALLLPIAAHLALLAAGMGVIRAAGVVRPLTPRTALAAGGLAYLVGVAIVMQACILMLVVGLPFSLVTVGVLCLVLATPLVWDLRWDALRRFRPRPSLPQVGVPRLSSEAWLATCTLAAFGALAIIGLVTLGNQPIGGGDYDAWNLWGRKAALMFYGSHLPLSVLQSPTTGYVHPDYPFVLPLLEALHMRAIGSYMPTSAHTVVWALAIAFLWAGVFLSARMTRPAIASLLFAGTVLLTAGELLTAYADLPMVFYLCLGVLALGIWLESGSRQHLILAALLLAGAAGIKNEGLLGAFVAFGVALVLVVVGHRRRQLAEIGAAGGAVLVLTILPWRLWLAVHHLKGDLPLAKGLDPVFLINRSYRVWPAVQGLYTQLTNTSSVAVLVPVALAILVLRLRRSDRLRAASFYLAVGVLYFAAMVWAYWISPLEIHFHIFTSVERIYLGIAFIALATILHLPQGLTDTWHQAPPDDEPAADEVASSLSTIA